MMPLILPRTSKVPAPSLTATSWAPVSYTTQVTGLTAGQTLMMPQASLQSGYNTPYFIDEIRFTVYGSAVATGVLNSSLASVVSFQLQTGNYFFSQAAIGSPSPVPMCLYAPTYSTTGYIEDLHGLAHGGVYRNFSTRRWCLPKPLWMPPGDIVQAVVTRDPTYGSDLGTFTAQVTVIGRSLPPNSPKPVARCVPHIGWYIQPSGVSYSEATQQFENCFKVPWYVQRLIMTTRSNPGFPGTNVSRLGFGMVEDATGAVQYFRTRIGDSLGYKITGSNKGGFVPMADVAQPSNDFSWTFGRSLPHDECYHVAFQNVSGSGTNFNQIQPMISFVGYREEQP